MTDKSYIHAVCKGAIALGSGCMRCEKCADQLAARVKELEAQIEAVGAVGVQALSARPVEPSITLDFKQATELLAMFGGEPGLVTLQHGGSKCHSGPGLYAWYSDLPEEGAEFLGAEPDGEARPAAPQAESPYDTMQLYKDLQDLWSEASAVDTIIGRPDVLLRKITKMRDAVGKTVAAYLPIGAATVQDERAAFEAWYCNQMAESGYGPDCSIHELREENHYGEHRVMLNGKWEGWQARAAIAAAPVAAPSPEVPEDTEANRRVIAQNPGRAIAIMQYLRRRVDELKAHASARQSLAPQAAPAQEPIAWESTTPAYKKYVTQSLYEKFTPAVRRWYKPYKCSSCGAAPQAAPAQEPVMIYHGRCTIDCGEHGHHDMEMLRMIPAGSKLYTDPQPAAPQAAPAVNEAATNWRPLKTSSEGRDALRQFMREKLNRHDFDDYITKSLAADFACVLGGYLAALGGAR